MRPTSPSFRPIVMPRLREILREVSSDTLVYYAHVFSDAAGMSYVPADVLEAISPTPAAPIFGAAETYVGRGIVGGHVFVPERVGQVAGELVLRVLRGESSESIPAVDVQSLWAFDAREAACWGVNESDLPPDSEIRFRERTLWSERRAYILGPLAFIILQTLLIGFLLRERQVRPRAESRALSLGHRLATAHEEERMELARDLHDNLQQQLGFLAITAGRLHEELASAGVQNPAPGIVRDRLVRLSGEVRALAHRLHPPELDQLGLTEALRVECARFSQVIGIPVQLIAASALPEPPRTVGLAIYRVVQEALQNVAKHARARGVVVSLEVHDGRLLLGVRDDGQGFRPGPKIQLPSVGLFAMRERVRAIGDTIYFDDDGNGQQDPGEPGVPGVTVTLGGDLDDVAVTGPNGEYLFTGVPAGSYTVTVDTGTGPFAGFTNTGDPDGGNDSTSAVTLGAGEDNLEQDFGYRGLDLGDAQNGYATLLVANGPSHFAVGPTLGSVRDTEADGQPGATATGDDLAGLPDDEDAVASPLAFTSGTNANVTLAYVNPGSGNATLCAWLDLNGTGGFEASELRVQTVPPGSSSVTLDFGTVSGGARSTYARFRFASASGCSPVGFATDGEVEDYQVTIEAAGKTPKIDIRKQAEGPDSRTFKPGSTVWFQIQVTNNGQAPLTGVAVTDPLLPACNRTFGSLAVGASRLYSCSTKLVGETKVFRDTFGTPSYSNNDGTHDWAGPWVEYDTAGSGPALGNVLIGSNAKLWLDDYPNTGTQPSARRTADLTGATSATLSFTWETHPGVDPADKVLVEVSKNGGASYRVLKSVTGFAGTQTGTESFNITGEISSQTTVRFRVASGYGEAQETFMVDDVAINVSLPAVGFTNEACVVGTGAGRQVSDCDTSTVVVSGGY